MIIFFFPFGMLFVICHFSRQKESFFPVVYVRFFQDLYLDLTSTCAGPTSLEPPKFRRCCNQGELANVVRRRELLLRFPPVNPTSTSRLAVSRQPKVKRAWTLYPLTSTTTSPSTQRDELWPNSPSNSKTLPTALGLPSRLNRLSVRQLSPSEQQQLYFTNIHFQVTPDLPHLFPTLTQTQPNRIPSLTMFPDCFAVKQYVDTFLIVSAARGMEELGLSWPPKCHCRLTLTTPKFPSGFTSPVRPPPIYSFPNILY